VGVERLLERDPTAVAAPLSALGDALRRMHTTFSSQYGKLAALARGEAPQTRRTEDIIMDRALVHLDAVAARVARLADAQHRIAAPMLDLAEYNIAKALAALCCPCAPTRDRG
jgi:hypothetical protein